MVALQLGRRVGVVAAAAAALLVALLEASIALASSSSSSSSPSSDCKSLVKSTVSAHDVVIFSQSYCPYCKTVKAVFKELELKKGPYVVELDQRDDGWEIQNALLNIPGRRSVPQVFVHGKHLPSSDIFDIICGPTVPQVFVHGKPLGPGALTILLRLAKVENWLNF